MKKRNLVRHTAVVLIAAAILQAGYMAYSFTSHEIKERGELGKTAALQANHTAGQSNPSTAAKPVKKEIDISRAEVSGDIENSIRALDGHNFDKNLKNYKRLLVEFNVEKKLQGEIEKMIKAGYPMPDILTAYDFLSDSYGRVEELKELLDKRKGGSSWEAIFTEYNQKQKEFVPRNFEAGYLEETLKEGNLSVDDIMIADKVSQKTGKPIKEFIDARKQGKTWKEINAGIGILNTLDTLPRISVTEDQINQYMADGQLTEKQVVESLSLANKMEKSEEEIINRMKAVKKKEAAYAQCCDEKYR